MKYEVIYQPTGKAMEFAETEPGANDGLACNIYEGCVHGCKYCFVPCDPYRPGRDEFHAGVKPRKNILRRLIKDCRKLEGDPRPVFLQFHADPYPPQYLMHDEIPIPCCGSVETRLVLQVMRDYGMTVRILSKGGMRGIRDLDIFQEVLDDKTRPQWWFGQTIVLQDQDEIDEWEPNAASYADRREVLRVASEYGAIPWASIEPVIDTEQALAVIADLRSCASVLKIGKINHGSAISEELGRREQETDWRAFCQDVQDMLKDWPGTYYFKQSLQRYL